ncbi:MAG: NACHT domain-containing protein [Bacillota bacterium]
MNNWIEIKKKINNETQQFFKTINDFNLNDSIELFEKVVTLPLLNTELGLDGLQTRVPNALYKIMVVDSGKDHSLSYFPDFAKVEPFLKKILYLINPTKYTELQNRNAGLAAYIDNLNLNPNNLSLSSSKIEDFLGGNSFDEHLIRVYNLRNIESHQCVEWTNKEFYENVQSILIFYVYSIHLNSSLLIPIVNVEEESIDFSGYLNSVKEDFAARIGRFIHIRSQEDIKITHGYVKEIKADEENEESERKGTVEELRNHNVPENRMFIWGDAGLGKSTTLEYLAYIDADNYLENNSTKIPVYLSLGLLTDKSISIKQIIFKKIGVDSIIGEKMLEEGNINLFLDAVNEIPKDENYQLKTIRLREIKNIIDDYPNTFIIITDRPQEANTFKGIPVFHLLKMDRDQINEFLMKNTDDSNLASLIFSEIEKDERIEKIIKTPLMLSRLIEIVKVENSIPKSEGEIIHHFITCLYKREQEEKMDSYFDSTKIHLLLRYLGYESLENKETNSGMTQDEVLNNFIKRKKEYGFDIDILYVLEKSTQLGILENRDGLYAFVHQAYQDYYHSQEEKGILEI